MYTAQVIACLCERLHQLAGDRSYIFCDTLATDSTDEGHDDWTFGGTSTGVGESVVQCPSDNVEGHLVACFLGTCHCTHSVARAMADIQVWPSLGL